MPNFAKSRAGGSLMPTDPSTPVYSIRSTCLSPFTPSVMLWPLATWTDWTCTPAGKWPPWRKRCSSIFPPPGPVSSLASTGKMSPVSSPGRLQPLRSSRRLTVKSSERSPRTETGILRPNSLTVCRVFRTSSPKSSEHTASARDKVEREESKAAAESDGRGVGASSSGGRRRRRSQPEGGGGGLVSPTASTSLSNAQSIGLGGGPAREPPVGAVPIGAKQR
eukprot:scaffold206682_cov31-Tisochrysis_lutea.AAC.2